MVRNGKEDLKIKRIWKKSDHSSRKITWKIFFVPYNIKH